MQGGCRGGKWRPYLDLGARAGKVKAVRAKRSSADQFLYEREAAAAAHYAAETAKIEKSWRGENTAVAAAMGEPQEEPGAEDDECSSDEPWKGLN